MFINLPSIRLPHEFVTLSCMQLLENRRDNNKIISILNRNKGISLVMEQICVQGEKILTLHDAISVMGWHGFRERVASAYVFHAHYKKFPVETDLTLIDDIIEFERNFEFISQKGTSRLFLLGLYFKFCDIFFEQTNSALPGKLLDKNEELIKILEMGKSKSARPDILILICWHFLEYFGFEALKENLKLNDLNFRSIYHLVDEEFKRKMSKNFLAYGAALNEDEIFTYDKV